MLQLAVKKIIVEEDKGVIKPSLPKSAKQQCAIWNNTIHFEISAPHNKGITLHCTSFSILMEVCKLEIGSKFSIMPNYSSLLIQCRMNPFWNISNSVWRADSLMPHNSPCQGVTTKRATGSPTEAIIHLTVTELTTRLKPLIWVISIFSSGLKAVSTNSHS